MKKSGFNLFLRVVACMLALSTILQWPLSTVAIDVRAAEVEQEEPAEEPEEPEEAVEAVDVVDDTATDENWTIKLNWGDPADNIPDDWCPEYTNQEDINVKIQVTVECKNEEGATYAPGSVTIALSDILGIDEWNYSHGGRLEKSINAVKVGEEGTGDWKYTETQNKTTGCYDYVFSNMNTIDTSFTSTFQILLHFTGDVGAKEVDNYGVARYFKVGYEQDIAAVMTVGGETITSNTLHYSWKGVKDSYILDLYEVENLEWGDTILSKIPRDNWEDYIFLKLKLSADFETYGSIVIQDGNHMDLALPEGSVLGTPVRASNFSDMLSDGDDSFFTDCINTRGEYEDGKMYVYVPVAVPKTHLESNNGIIDLTGNWYGTYYGETDEVLLDTDTLSINLNDFNIVYNGELYALKKETTTTNNENYLESMQYFYGKDVIGGRKNTWYLGATAVYYGKEYDLVLGDDLQYYIYTDNTYRRVENDEKVIYSVRVKLPKDADSCGYEIYGKKLGGDGSYQLLQSGQLDSSSYWNTYFKSTISTNETRYYDVKVKITGLNVSLDKTDTLVTLETYFMDNTEKDNGKTINRIYNFGYMQIEIDDELVEMEYESISTLDGLSDEIHQFDADTYGKTVLREKAYAPIGEIVFMLSTLTSSINSIFQYVQGSDCLTNTVIFDCDVENRPGIPVTIKSYTDKIFIPNYVDYDLESLRFRHNSLPSKDTWYTAAELAEMGIGITITEEVSGEKNVIVVKYDFSADPIITDDGQTVIYLYDMKLDLSASLDDYYMLGLKNKSPYVYHALTSMDIIDNHTGLSHRLQGSYTGEALSFPDIARGSYQAIEKEVAGSDGVYTKTDTVVVDSDETYSYKLRISGSATRTTNIVLYDNIENYNTESWKGAFAGYRLSGFEKAGLDTSGIAVYYSSNRDQTQDLSADGWILASAWTAALSDVKAIAFDFGTHVIEPNSLLYVEVQMKAPDAETHPAEGDITENQTTVSYVEYDPSDTDLMVPLNTVTNLPSNITKVALGEEVVSITVNKTWDDNNNEYGLRPDSVTIHLSQNNEVIESYELTESEGWTHTFSGLLKYDADQNEYVYTIKEDPVTGYRCAIQSTGDAASLAVTITNTVKQRNVSGTKIWDDEEDAYHLRPDSVTVNLLQNGVKIDSAVVSEDSDWKYEFTDLRRYAEDTSEYTYTVVEETVPFYKTEYDTSKIDGGLRITFSEECETEAVKWDYVIILYKRGDAYYQAAKLGGTEIAGAVVDIPAYAFYLYWHTDDSNSKYYGFSIDSVEPLSGTVADGEVSELPDVAVIETETLPESKHGNYGINNDLLYYYESGYESDTSVINIVNSCKYTSLSGTKTWDDLENAMSTRPESVTVNLLRDGVKVSSATTDASKDWKYSFNGLPIYKNADGEEYAYTVKEEPVDNYEASYADNRYTGTRITFSEQSITEARYDYVDVFFEKDGVYYLVTSLSGTNIAGAVVDIPSDNFYLYWNSDVSVCDGYGWKIDTIEGIMGEIQYTENVYNPDFDEGTVIEKTDGDVLESAHTDTGYGTNVYETYHYSSDNLKNQYNIINTLTELPPREVTVTKRIKASDINFANGTPTFIFKLSGTEVTGQAATYYKAVKFTKEYVEANTEADGYVSITAVFERVVPGNYVLNEEDISRYEFESMSDVVNGTIDGETVKFDLVTNESGQATFTNKVYENQWFSHNDIVVNRIGTD